MRRRHKHGELVARILCLIDEYGSATCADIHRLLNVPDDTVRAVMSRLISPGRKTGKRLYIVAWAMEAHGERRYPRAVYARYEGRKHRDVPKPSRGTLS